LAATIGWMIGTCEVANTAARCVMPPTPAAQVKVSKQAPLKLVVPPNPRQRATGTSASKPAASPRPVSSLTLGQVGRNTPSMVVMAQALSTLRPNSPSLNRLSP
jgi:hypothetical protein